jgi:hypothetical protein
VVNPTPHVDAAIVTESLDGGEPYYDGYFSDDEQSVHQTDINKIYEAGITKGCNPPANDNYCPQDEITRGQMAAFLRRNLALPSVEEDFFEDDTGTVFEDDINALSAVGIGFGCSDVEYCSDIPLLREELAELFVRTFEYDNPEEVDFFVDDDGNRFEESINALANHGITLGCNPPDNTNFCPERSLTRAEMASFFVRALGL